MFIAFSLYSKGMDKEIPPAERQYINEVLNKITADSSKEDIITLLGDPTRDLGLKVNWMVTINGNEDRIVVYFSGTTGKATGISFDVGTGRFYYRKDLDR
jgi:hypothetical protein